MESESEFQIAMGIARVLHRLTHSSSDDDDGLDDCSYSPYSAKPSREDRELSRLYRAKAELAWSRAKARGRDFKTVMKETEFKVRLELARILAPTINPVLGVLEEVEFVGSGETCGVCQEEMEVGGDVRAMGCGHRFHGCCIFNWLQIKNACPLCRFQA